MKNIRDEINRDYRISHDELYNIYHLCFQLKFCGRLDRQVDFVSRFTLHPRILVHLMAYPLISSMNQLLKVANEPVSLHCDTLFNMGDYYLSTLSYRHGIFKGEPIVPAAFFIHSRRFHNDHLDFFKSFTAMLPSILTKKINIITDREFQLNGAFPIANHLFCWNHIENDLLWYLKDSCNASPEDINYFVKNETEIEFDREWEDVKNMDRFSAKPKVLNYFVNNLIPVFKGHAAIWLLKEAGIHNPDRGITNNPSESMNAVLKRLKEWKQVPLDVICLSLYHLSIYYYRELERSIHQCGQWEVKEEFDYLRREPSLIPKLPVVITPKDIVEKVRMSSLDISLVMEEMKEESPQNNINTGNTQVGLAYTALKDSRVNLVGDGSFVVKEADDMTRRIVTLFPKETCSCPSVTINLFPYYCLSSNDWLPFESVWQEQLD